MSDGEYRYVKGIPFDDLSNAEQIRIAEQFVKDARQAPVIDTPIIKSVKETGNVINVLRVGKSPKGDVYWVVTSDNATMQVPRQLHMWADDLIVMMLSSGGNKALGVFPCEIEFGIIRGRYYANILGD
jgi:hypothetical protein